MMSNRAAVRQFLAQGTGGSILNMGSILGWSPSLKYFATHGYAAAKAAIVGSPNPSLQFPGPGAG
jgi:short-subunit dehydrogenase